jgi:nucleoid-associated protein YgaU
MPLDDLTTAVTTAAALVGALVLAPVARRAVGVLSGAVTPVHAALRRRVHRLREIGAAVLARRAAAGLLGSASAVLAVAAPARAAAPDRSVATAPQAASSHTTRVHPVAAHADVVVVRRGDTLWGLARRHLRPGATDAEIARAWPFWYAANRAVIGPDPGLLLPGQRLRVPGARPTGTSSTPHHRSPVRAPGDPTATPATSFDPDRR